MRWKPRNKPGCQSYTEALKGFRANRKLLLLVLLHWCHMSFGLSMEQAMFSSRAKPCLASEQAACIFIADCYLFYFFNRFQVNLAELAISFCTISILGMLVLKSKMQTNYCYIVSVKCSAAQTAYTYFTQTAISPVRLFIYLYHFMEEGDESCCPFSSWNDFATKSLDWKHRY